MSKLQIHIEPGHVPAPAALPEPLDFGRHFTGRMFTRTGRANIAWRLGEALGQRFGRIDPRIRPLPVSLLERYLAGGGQ